MTVVELTRAEATRREADVLDRRYRLDALVSSIGDTTLWRAADLLLCRPVAVHLLPGRRPVPASLTKAVQECARVSDPRLATVFDVDYHGDRRYIVSEWVTDPDLEQLLHTGLPGAALAVAIVADAADALAVAHQAGRPHLRLSLRSVHWGSSGLKITGLGIDAALSAASCLGSAGLASSGASSGAASGPAPAGAAAGAAVPGVLAAAGSELAEAAAADTAALARILYALLTGYWPGDEPTSLPLAPGNRFGRCEPRQVRPDVPPMLNAIVCHAMGGQAGWGVPSISTPADLAAALRAASPAPASCGAGSGSGSGSVRQGPPAGYGGNRPVAGRQPMFHAA